MLLTTRAFRSPRRGQLEVLSAASFHRIPVGTEPQKSGSDATGLGDGAPSLRRGAGLGRQGVPGMGRGAEPRRALVTELGADHAVPVKDNRSTLLDDIGLLDWNSAAESAITGKAHGLIKTRGCAAPLDAPPMNWLSCRDATKSSASSPSITSSALG